MEKKANSKISHTVHFLEVFLVAAIFSAIIWIALYFARPELQQKETLAEPVSLLSTAKVTTTGCDISGNSYTLQEDITTAQILFEEIPISYQTVEISLGENLDYGVQLRVYGTDTTGAYSDDNSVVITGDGTAADYIVELPELAADQLLIEIDGDFILDDIQVSEQAPVETNQEEAPISMKLLVMLMVVNALLFLLLDHYWSRICEVFGRAWLSVRERFHAGGIAGLGIRLLQLLWLPLVSAIAALAFGYLLSRWTDVEIFRKEKIFCILAGLVIGCLIRMRRLLKEHLARVFWFAAASCGVLILVLSPVSTNLNYEDGLHYERTLALSYGGTAYLTQADLSLIEENYRPSFENESTDRAHDSLLNDEYREGAVRVQSNPDIFQPENLGYLPAALGLMTGRVLHLSFDGIFVMGRIFSLLFYLLLTTLGIHSLRYGKLLAALIALLPVNLYQGCSYSNEGWVFCWLFFAVCRYLGFLQDQERKWSVREMLIIVGSILLGCAVKPVYLPVLVLLFVVPGNRFAGRRQRIRYYSVLSIFAAALIAIAAVHFSAVLPALADTEVNPEADAVKQLAWILENPGEYFSTALYEIIVAYLPLQNSASYLTYSGYFPANLWNGEGVYAYQFPAADLWALLLLVTAFTEGSEDETRAVSDGTALRVKLTFGVSAFLSLFLMATACYLSFSSVSSDTIQGLEGRFLAPLLLMLLWLFRCRKCEIKAKRGNVRFVILLLAMALFLLGAGSNAF